jgi:hypothetical protein
VYETKISRSCLALVSSPVLLWTGGIFDDAMSTLVSRPHAHRVQGVGPYNPCGLGVCDGVSSPPPGFGEWGRSSFCSRLAVVSSPMPLWTYRLFDDAKSINLGISAAYSSRPGIRHIYSVLVILSVPTRHVFFSYFLVFITATHMLHMQVCWANNNSGGARASIALP